MPMAELTPAPDGYPIKLVRDNTPSILNRSGDPGDLWYGPCPADQIDRRLRAKLAEEVAEFLIDGGADELADVLSVVYAISERHNWRVESIAAHDVRGGFRNAVMMYGRHPEFDGPEGKNAGRN